MEPNQLSADNILTPFSRPFSGAILGCILVALWLTLDSLLAPFGSLWAPFELPLAPFGSLLAPFGLPLARFGSLLVHFWLPLAHIFAPFGSLFAPFGSLLLHFLTLGVVIGPFPIFSMKF